MNDKIIEQIASDLGVTDLPEKAQTNIIRKFADSFMSRSSVEIAANMDPTDAKKLSEAEGTEEKISIIENAYGQSFAEINDVLYEELVAEFKDLMNE